MTKPIDGTAFDGDHIVPVSRPEDGPDAQAADKLSVELQEIVDRKVEGEVSKAIWESVSRFAVEIMRHKNPKLTCAAFCFAAGLYVTEGKSITQLAKECGVSKQALDHRINIIVDKLDLPRSRGLKSQQARDNYKANHKRKVKSGK